MIFFFILLQLLYFDVERFNVIVVFFRVGRLPKLRPVKLFLRAPGV